MNSLLYSYSGDKESGWLSCLFSCLSPLWIGSNANSDQSIGCVFGFQSLPDCVGFLPMGFTPTSKTGQSFFLFPIHSVIDANCAFGCVIRVNENSFCTAVHNNCFSYRPVIKQWGYSTVIGCDCVPVIAVKQTLEFASEFLSYSTLSFILLNEIHSVRMLF